MMSLVVLIVFTLVTDVIGHCTFESGTRRFFGPSCEARCHCVDSDTCDELTGECQNGCEPFWYGRRCQLTNDLALGTLARHLDNTDNKLWSVYATDGNLSTYSETDTASAGYDRETSPYLRVMLREVRPIQALVITPTESSLEYFIEGFNVTVEVVLETPEYYKHHAAPHDIINLCYEHVPNEPLTSPFEVVCNDVYYGNLVRIKMSNKFTQLALYDVKVIGECLDSQWGPLCNETCGNCDGPLLCDVRTGACPAGCQAGYQGRLCKEKCNNNRWGNNCSKSCGHCADSNSCDAVTGICLTGCGHGFQGPRCILRDERISACNGETRTCRSKTLVLGGFVGVILGILALISMLVFYRTRNILPTRIKFHKMGKKKETPILHIEETPEPENIETSIDEKKDISLRGY